MRKPALKKHAPEYAAILFFIVMLGLGFALVKGFGVPYDEPVQTELAVWNHRYIFKGDLSLLSYDYRYLGVTFELPLLWIQSRFTAPAGVFARHLALYLAWLAGLLCLYSLSRRLFHNPWWALLTVTLAASSPRIFADAFYNSKDIPFMVMFTVAVGTLVWLLDAIKQKRRGRAVWAALIIHALTSGLLVGIRVPGIAIVPITLVLLALIVWGANATWKRGLAILIGYLILSIGFIILFWPILWHDPLGEFINAFKLMSRYDVYGKATLYLGQFVSTSELPWHYLPVWIAISTPLIVLAGLLIGIPAGIRQHGEKLIRAVRSGRGGLAETASNADAMPWLAVSAWLVVPIVAAFLFQSVMYSGWRHLYFIYPPLVLLAVYGLRVLHGWIAKRLGPGRDWAARAATFLILAIGLAGPLSFTLRYPLHGYVYFNGLAGNPASLRQRFPLDYWGLSYKQAIDYILAHDPRDSIRIYSADTPGLNYIYGGLDPQSRSRVVVAQDQDDDIDYFIGDFAYHPDDYFSSRSEYFSISVRGVKIIVVYRFP